MRDFYRHQEHALVQTARLVTILGVALGGTVLLSAVGIGYIVVVFNVIEQVPVDLWTAFIETFAVSVPVISVVIAVGSFIKIYQLRGGGSVVAEQLGGTLISDGHADASHRKVLNIVEEIAIASGVLVPPVYVMEGEPGINAFAAGYSHHDAVIAVTRGCIDRLSREQLQGVIAHEFSHIFNGDMRLNIRAIGVLHGILTLTLLAEWFIHEGLKIMATGGRGRRDGTFVGVAFVICGAIIWPIGTVGLVLSLVIKSAINRQREYLADASAVEFTRNPAGLAGALKVIGGYAVGGRVRNPSAVEASHLFFTDGCRGFSRLFHSHPPLEDRIKRIEPDWDGVHLFEEERDIAPYGGAFQGTMNLIGGSSRPRAQQVDRTTLSAERDE